MKSRMKLLVKLPEAQTVTHLDVCPEAAGSASKCMYSVACSIKMENQTLLKTYRTIRRDFWLSNGSSPGFFSPEFVKARTDAQDAC